MGLLLPKKRFQVVPDRLHYQYIVMIEDYTWWTTNEREILNWMADNLPNGIDHQQGMVVKFDTEEDRLMFLLKWA